MGTGFAKKKKQAKMLQNQLSQMQTQLQQTEVVGSAGNGLVTVTLTGEYDLKKVQIKPECVDPEDIEGLQDLIRAAYEDAKKQLESQTGALGKGMPNLGMFGM